MRKHSVIRICTLFVLLSLPVAAARGDLSRKEARNAIAKAAGFSLPTDSIRITRVTSLSATSAEVSARLELVFRMARDEQSQWRIQDLRTGDAQWDGVDSIAQAAKFDLQQDACDTTDTNGRLKPESSLTIKRARCLVANLFGVTLPADAVRVKEISSLGLGTQPSALAISLVQVDFRLAKDSSGWRAVALHSGNRSWIDLDAIAGSLDSVKRQRTTEEMNDVVAALDSFKRDRGSFVISEKHAVLIDNLSPRYLNRVIRVDAWQRPYLYQGDRDHFTLRSVGPDGKENTPDDIVVSQ